MWKDAVIISEFGLWLRPALTVEFSVFLSGFSLSFTIQNNTQRERIKREKNLRKRSVFRGKNAKLAWAKPSQKRCQPHRPQRDLSLSFPSLSPTGGDSERLPNFPRRREPAATIESGPAGGCDRCRFLAQLPRGAEAATGVSERVRPPTRKSVNARARRSKRNGMAAFQKTKKEPTTFLINPICVLVRIPCATATQRQSRGDEHHCDGSADRYHQYNP